MNLQRRIAEEANRTNYWICGNRPTDSKSLPMIALPISLYVLQPENITYNNMTLGKERKPGDFQLLN